MKLAKSLKFLKLEVKPRQNNLHALIYNQYACND